MEPNQDVEFEVANESSVMILTVTVGLVQQLKKSKKHSNLTAKKSKELTHRLVRETSAAVSFGLDR